MAINADLDVLSILMKSLKMVFALFCYGFEIWNGVVFLVLGKLSMFISIAALTLCQAHAVLPCL